MPIVTTTYPGVYIDESAELSLSVSSSATAVPVFAANSTKMDFSVPKRIDSWLEFTKLKLEKPLKETDTLYLALRTYFENGGGYCHIVAADKLEAEVPKLDDVTLVVAAGEKIKAAVAVLCEPSNTRFAILDGPENETELAKDKLPLAYDENPCAAVYYPWLNADWAQPKAANKVAIPPSAAVAGAYCTVDRERGVWKAPANIELKGGVTPIVQVSDDDQGKYMDDRPINMLRQFRGTGTTIWGARTLSSNIDWRYIPVRRLFNTAERDIKKAMSVAMFEPNSQPTWERVRAAIDNYLHAIWKQGGLTGNTEKEAYFVQVGKGITMTEADIDQGKMIVKIGMAAVRPAEFIILKFTQNMAQG